MQRPPLLITASLDAGTTPLVALRNVQERTLSHMKGLIAWLKDPGISRIVFAKNCRVQIRGEVLVEAGRKHGKELEFLQVEASPRTALQGKGFGEGDLIRKVLERSIILEGSNEFMKVTGKLYAPGWEKVFSGSGKGDFYESVPLANREMLRLWTRQFYLNEGGSRLMGFFKRRMRVPWGIVAATPRGWIDTRIYRVNRQFYTENLREAHRRVQDALNYTLENAFFDDLHSLSNSKTGYGIRRIRDIPIIIGMSGSLSEESASYSEGISREAKILAENVLRS
jgi:hypothetical protein